MKRRRKRSEENLILIGFMGSGKTTVGIRLSYLLKRAFEDTDKLIEKREGRSISNIFAAEGEAYFRSLETQLLRELSGTLHNRIVSAGGGTPLLPENRRLLSGLGTVVLLRIRPESVYERLRGDTSRPLLQGGEPLKRIRELMEARQAVYEEAADIIVDVDGLDMEEVLSLILEKWRKRQHEAFGD